MKPMTLRLPDELRLALQGEANRQGRSLHGHIIWVLQGSVTVFVPTQVHTVVIPPSHPPETPWPLRMPQAVSPPLDAQGIATVKKGKAAFRPTRKQVAFAESEAAYPTHEELERLPEPIGVYGYAERDLKPGEPLDELKPICTCGPGERAKGKHNKYCPLRGK